jgi:F-type H+-transporting ATPase subunit gamma
VNGITPLITNLLLDINSYKYTTDSSWHVFYHKQKQGAIYQPVHQVLLPLDKAWHKTMLEIQWPSGKFPQLISEGTNSLVSFIHEYLFVNLFEACAHSLASENASRMASMQRAEKNIGELLENLNLSYHRLRQNNIDEELFDVISGFEALTRKKE